MYTSKKCMTFETVILFYVFLIIFFNSVIGILNMLTDKYR